MTLDTESQHKEFLDVFIRTLQAAPDSLIKSLTGKEFVCHVIDGVREIKDFIYSQGGEE